MRFLLSDLSLCFTDFYNWQDKVYIIRLGNKIRESRMKKKKNPGASKLGIRAQSPGTKGAETILT